MIELANAGLTQLDEDDSYIVPEILASLLLASSFLGRTLYTSHTC